MLLKANTVAFGHLSKANSSLKIVVTNLLRKTGKRSRLSNNKGWHRQALSSQLTLKLLNEGVVLVGGGQTTVCLLGTNLIANLRKTARNTFLLAPLNQINCTAKNHIKRNNLANLKRILSWINHQQVKTVKHVGKIGLLGKLHSFIFWKVSVALLVALPRTTVVTTEVIQSVKANLLSCFSNIFRETLLIPRIYVSSTKFIKVYLVSRCNKHQRKIAVSTKFKSCLKQVGRHWSNSQKRGGLSCVLKLKQPFNSFFNW